MFHQHYDKSALYKILLMESTLIYQIYKTLYHMGKQI